MKFDTFAVHETLNKVKIFHQLAGSASKQSFFLVIELAVSLNSDAHKKGAWYLGVPALSRFH